MLVDAHVCHGCHSRIVGPDAVGRSGATLSARRSGILVARPPIRIPGRSRFAKPHGAWQSMKIAAAAEAHEINVAPHNSYGHLFTMVIAHFAAAVPNLRIMSSTQAAAAARSSPGRAFLSEFFTSTTATGGCRRRGCRAEKKHRRGDDRINAGQAGSVPRRRRPFGSFRTVPPGRWRAYCVVDGTPGVHVRHAIPGPS